MDLHDKQFDRWLKDQLTKEIPLTRSNRQAAWEQICSAAFEPVTIMKQELENDFVRINAPIVIEETVTARIWRWIRYIVAQENSYHIAHANSLCYYKSNTTHTGGLKLHNLEIMRHRWTCAV